MRVKIRDGGARDPALLGETVACRTPKGVGFRNFLSRVLSAGTGGKPLWESAEAFKRRAVAYNALVQPGPMMSRNARCSCGSGLIYEGKVVDSVDTVS